MHCIVHDYRNQSSSDDKGETDWSYPEPLTLQTPELEPPSPTPSYSQERRQSTRLIGHIEDLIQQLGIMVPTVEESAGTAETYTLTKEEYEKLLRRAL